MVGHRRFDTLTSGWTPERRAEVARRAAEVESEIATLEELRQALGLSQANLAERLDVAQPAVSKLERRGDMRISTLRDLIQALGGELRITADFAERSVEISNFQTDRAQRQG